MIASADKGRRVNREDIELVWRQDFVDITRPREGIIELKVKRRKTPRAPNRWRTDGSVQDVQQQLLISISHIIIND